MNPIQFKIRAGSLADAQAEWDRLDLKSAHDQAQYNDAFADGLKCGCVLMFILCAAVAVIVFTLKGW